MPSETMLDDALASRPAPTQEELMRAIRVLFAARAHGMVAFACWTDDEVRRQVEFIGGFRLPPDIVRDIAAGMMDDLTQSMDDFAVEAVNATARREAREFAARRAVA